jgi:hypothetical protein
MQDLYGPQYFEVFLYSDELNIWQRMWLELIKDYDCEINYHPSKANVLTNALNIIKSRSLHEKCKIYMDHNILKYFFTQMS